jgi:hypothetical protein
VELRRLIGIDGIEIARNGIFVEPNGIFAEMTGIVIELSWSNSLTVTLHH